jgi:LDH2 family malate/lactate/ureidoglycolate dehydrogenase
MNYYPLKKVEDFAASLLTARGVPEADAAYMAGMAVRTEAMGITTHGLSVLAYLDTQIPEVFPPETEPEIISEKASTILIDAKMGFSQLAMRTAVEKTLEKAAETGIAMAAIRNASWLGALGPYLEPIARSGYLAQLWGQSSQCRDCAPIGGIEGKFSTNPVALAFPAPGNPVIADISTASVSMGAVNRMAKNGEKARDRIFMDKEGHATDDPNAMLDRGSIFFLGGPEYGHKGYGLSLWAEALTAMSGASCNNPDKDQTQNLNLTVIDAEAFGGSGYFQKEISRFISHMKSSGLRPGYDEIRLPGENSFRKLAQAEKRGLPLDDGKLEMLNGIARNNGIDPLK